MDSGGNNGDAPNGPNGQVGQNNNGNLELPNGWTWEHAARALTRYIRKRDSMEPPEEGDESDTEYHLELHKKGKKGMKPTAQQEKNYKILLEKLRLHFARYLSVNDDEIFDMMEESTIIVKIYTDDIGNDTYWRLEDGFLRIKEKAKSVARQWQKLMLNAIEDHITEVIPTVAGMAHIADEETLSRIFLELFVKNNGLETLHQLLNFTHGSTDCRRTKTRNVLHFYCNQYTWLCVYVRRAQLLPGKEGRCVNDEFSIFDRVKTMMRTGDWGGVKIEDLPVDNSRRYENSRKRGKKKATNALHPGLSFTAIDDALIANNFPGIN